MQDTLVIESIHGSRADPALAQALHDLSHRGLLETLVIDAQDLPRRRFHAHTDRGRPCFIALPRDEPFFDGAVAHLSDDCAVVVRVGEQQWLRVSAVDAAAALELGYLAGNLHWRIRFDAAVLAIALEASRDAYVARLRTLLDAGRVRIHD